MKVQAVVTGEQTLTLGDTALHKSRNHKDGNKGGKSSATFK